MMKFDCTIYHFPLALVGAAVRGECEDSAIYCPRAAAVASEAEEESDLRLMIAKNFLPTKKKSFVMDHLKM